MSSLNRDLWLVTGGAGFIGSTFVRRRVLDQQRQTLTLDKLTYAGNLDSLEGVLSHDTHRFVEGDIANRELVLTLLRQHRPTTVVNFAAESHVDRSIDGPRAFVETNVLGTVELLQATLHYWRELPPSDQNEFRFLHVSTDEVYGSLGPTGAFTETTPYAPNSPYSASKAASDHFVRAFHYTYGLPVLTTNCSNNYGPRQFPEKLIPLMILNAVHGKPLPIYGDGLNIRDWLYVEDHCRAIEAVIQRGRPGEVYNIGGNCERTNRAIVERICQIVDELCPRLAHRPCSQLVRFVADRPGHDRRYAIDCTKIERELGWSPEVAFEEGLRRTIEWYLGNPTWIDRVTSGTYRGERLGLAGGGTAQH
ncbi:MAG: dTDP-glucose 4,6-dehydratase [Planctomycetaceae bacterium]